MNMHKRWFLSVIGLTLLLLLLWPIVNFVIDPWGLNNLFRIPHVNSIKSKMEGHAKLYKICAEKIIYPDAIILGSSRTQQGISTYHPGWGTSVDTVYNFAVDSASIHEISVLFHRALALRPLKKVVIGLDMFSFDVYRDDPIDLEALAACDDRIKYLKLFLTEEMTKDSYSSIAQNIYSQGPGTYILPNGQTNPLFIADGLRRAGGHHKFFLLNERAYMKTGYLPPPRTQFGFHDAGGHSTMNDLKEIIKTVRRDNIDLRLFISPVHARQLEVIRVLGLWQTFEQWKRELVELLAEDAAAHPSQLPIPLWDFGGYNSLTAENLPSLDDKTTPMRWYWESSHYKQAVGDFVLDRLFDYKSPDRHVPDDFGALINQKNVDAHLMRIRREYERYRATHGADIAEVEESYEQTRKDFVPAVK